MEASLIVSFLYLGSNSTPSTISEKLSEIYCVKYCSFSFLSSSFPRFNKKFDRIKTTCAYNKIEELKVKYILGDPVFYNGYSPILLKNRDIFFSYNVGYKKNGRGHFVRKHIKHIILKSKYKDIIDIEKHKDFINHIRKCKVLICPIGWSYLTEDLHDEDINIQELIKKSELPGCISRRHLYTLQSGTLLLVYQTFKNLKIFNDIDLVENQDYITFTLDNLEEKLDYCYNNLEDIERIANNGFEKFKKGANLKKNSQNFLKFLKTI